MQILQTVHMVIENNTDGANHANSMIEINADNADSANSVRN